MFLWSVMLVVKRKEEEEERWEMGGASAARKHLVKLHGGAAETIGRKRKEGKDRDSGCEMSQQGKTVTLCPALWNIRSTRADNSTTIYPYVYNIPTYRAYVFHIIRMIYLILWKLKNRFAKWETAMRICICIRYFNADFLTIRLNSYFVFEVIKD